LGDEELQIIETAAWEVMEYLYYETKLVGKLTSPSVYSEEQVREFDKLNKVGTKENDGKIEKR